MKIICSKKWNIIFHIIFSLIIFSTTVQAQNLCKPGGWATQNGGTTGGGNATAITVTNLADLQAAAKSSGAKVIYVKGTMGTGVGTRVVVASDKTIFGMPGATLIGGFDVKSAKNVIIRNMKVQGPGSVDVDGVDCITIQSSTNVWIDHCDVYDGQDGDLDIVDGSNYVSVSWTKFHYTSASQNHQFCNLLGNSDSKTSDRGKIKVTMQYNWWTDGVRERMPRVRFGQVHVVNNLFTSSAGSYCVRAGIEADILVESNVFNGVKIPIDLYQNNFTAVTVKNNIFNNTSGNTAGSKTSFTPPYSLNITPAAQVEALVRSGAGATLTSPDCGNTTNQAPTVSIASPSNNSSFTAPANITINVNAADADGTVSNVQFFNGSTLLGSDASSPYSFAWTNVATGTYVITAKATDNSGTVTTSSAVNITVNAPNQAPAVNITAPANGVSFIAPASITITANATDADGTISSVQFFNGTTLLGSDVTAPYGFAWTNVAAGTYSITAKATDNRGAVTTSSAVVVNVNVAPAFVTFQAETACAVTTGIVNESKNAGFHGSGYVNTDNAAGTSIAWAFNSASSQTVTLTFRYANATSGNRTASLAVNGIVQVSSLSFVSTGAWTTWTTVNVNLNLAAGNNTIKLTALTSDGCANIDELVFNSGTIYTGSCSSAAAAPQSIASPNPTSASFSLTAVEAIQSITVVDMTGLTVYSYGAVAEGEPLQFGNDLTSGLYILNIIYANGRTEQSRIQKIQ